MIRAVSAVLRPAQIGWLAGMLATSVVCAVLVWWAEVGREESLAQAAFERNADLVFGAVKGRLATVQAIMNSGAAYLSQHPGMTDNEWRGFVGRVLSSGAPGVEGMAVVTRVFAADRPAFLQDIQSRLWRDFTPHPASGRDPAMLVILAQPPSRQEAVLGQDMSTLPLRRQVLEQAAESGQVSLSAPLRPISAAPGHDFILVQPVFRPDFPIDSPTRRHVALWGWLVTGLRVQTLIDAALAQVEDPLFDLEVYFGPVTGENKIYDGRRPEMAVGGGLTTVRALDVAGARWSVVAHRHLPAHALWLGRAPMILLSVSIGFGVALTAAAALLIISREQSRLLAQQTMGQLTRTERHLAGITASVPGAVFQWVQRADGGGFSFLSAQAGPMFGIDPEAVVADWRALPFEAADLERWPAAMARACAGGPEEWRMEGRYRGGDGSLRWWSGSACATSADDGSIAVNGIFLDITARKDAESALAERELTYRDMFLRTSAVGVLIDPATGRVVDANPAAQTYYGLALSALQDMDIVAVSRMDPEAVRTLLADCADGEQRFYRSRHCLASGEVREVEVHMGPVRVHGRQFVHAIVHDVTDRERYQAQLQDKTAKLEASNAELEQFSYVASHDLQEPLRTIASFLQLIERRYNDRLDDNGREFIGFAVEAATRLQAMIRDLLDYSRIGTRGNPFAATDMDMVLRVVRDNLARSIAETGAEISAPALPPVWADQRQMVSLLQNLIGNALKYRQPDRPLHIAISARAEGCDWVFAVADNGIGIEPDYFERIFLVFQRLHTRDKYEGTGIGLALCRKIVHRHGGEIWVESTPGVGTTFLFRLPGIQGHAVTDNQPGDQPGGAISKPEK